jgi:hypothetical protein
MTDKEKNPVVAVAQKIDGEDNEIEVLSTGYRAKIIPVSASLIDQVTAQIKDPPVPMWANESKGIDEPNPNDPAYIEALEDAGRKRGMAAMDAIIMFGVDLLDPIPEGHTWIRKLQILGIAPEMDENDEIEREFNFKKFVAVAAEDVSLVAQKSGISGEDIEEAERTFQRSKK